MKFNKKSIIYILTGFIFITVNPVYLLAQETFDEEFVVPLSKPGEIGSLYINLRGGAISISGYDGKEVVVNASLMETKHKDKNKDKNKDDNSEGLKRIPNNNLDFSIRERDNKVVIEYNNWKRGMALEVKVPRKFNLSLESHMGREIKVDGVTGEMEIESHHGSITLNNIGGSAIASSHNGSIVVDFNSIKGETPMAFSTYNGKIDLTFPSNLKANTKLQTRMGEIFTDFDMEIIRVAPKKQTRNEHGTFEIKIDEWVTGRINGGGPEMICKTRNGNIYIRKRK